MAGVLCLRTPIAVARRRPAVEEEVRETGSPAATLAGVALALPALLAVVAAPVPVGARTALAALAAFAALALAGSAATALAGRTPAGARAVQAALLAAILGSLLGAGFLLALLLFVLVTVFRRSLVLPESADLALLALAAAIAADAGSIATGLPRGPQLLALAAALALFGRLVDDAPTLLLTRAIGGGAARRRFGLLRDAAVALAGLAAMIACLALLSARPGVIGVVGLDGWGALVLFAAALLVARLRGRRAPGRTLTDPWVIVAAALAALAIGAVSATGPALAVP